MSTNDVAQQRVAIEEVERRAVAAHLQAEDYRQKLEDVKLLRSYVYNCAQKMYDSVVRSDSSLQGVSLEDYIKGPNVGPAIHFNYRAFCDASSRAANLEDMIRSRENQINEALVEWKHLRSFAPRDYVSSVEGFETLRRSTRPLQ